MNSRIAFEPQIILWSERSHGVWIKYTKMHSSCVYAPREGQEPFPMGLVLSRYGAWLAWLAISLFNVFQFNEAARWAESG